jgi:hypothetical protein
VLLLVFSGFQYSIKRTICRAKWGLVRIVARTSRQGQPDAIPVVVRPVGVRVIVLHLGPSGLRRPAARSIRASVSGMQTYPVASATEA